MKLKLFMASVIGVMTISGTGFGGEVSSKAAAQANNTFGWQIFESIQKSESATDNFLFSPLSAWLALSLAANGAESETLTEMKRVLAQNAWTQAEGNSAVKILVEDLLKGRKTEETLKIANAIWTNSDVFNLSATFLDEASAYYSLIPDEEIAFNDSFAQAETLQKINDWVDRKTEGMIPTILDQLEPDMAAILLNALYFKAQWFTPFTLTSTIKKPFYKSDGSLVDVSMMRNSKDSYLYADSKSYKMLSLSFRSGIDQYEYPLRGRFMLDLLIPATAGEKLGNFNKESYENLLNKLERKLVHVEIPKFKFDYEKSLNADLKAAGMQRIFDRRNSQMKRLGETRDGSNIYVSSVLQKTAVEMDEAGFKAAAVTSIIVSATSSVESPNLKTFIADRPFFLALRDSKTGGILFQGVIGHPNAR